MSKEPRQRSAFSLRGALSFLGSLVGLHSDAPSAAAARNTQRRDFCFGTRSGPRFFSTRAEYVTPFGFSAGDVLVYGEQHALRGWRCVVVGERAGRLWVVDEGAVSATPADAVNATELRERYGFTKVGTQRLAAAPEPANLTPEARHMLCTLPDLLVRVNDGTRLLHFSPVVSAADGTLGWADTGCIDNGAAAAKDGPLGRLSMAAAAILA
jgi:hypothetical protein